MTCVTVRGMLLRVSWPEMLAIKKHKARLTAIDRTTWLSRHQNISILDFVETKDDEDGGDKAPVKSSPPTYHHPNDETTNGYRCILLLLLLHSFNNAP